MFISNTARIVIIIQPSHLQNSGLILSRDDWISLGSRQRV
jgi:hypothetical protein